MEEQSTTLSCRIVHCSLVSYASKDVGYQFLVPHDAVCQHEADLEQLRSQCQLLMLRVQLVSNLT